MRRKSAFVKVSGNVYKSEKFIGWIREISRNYFVVVCVGGGTQINKAFEKKGRKKKPHGPAGRELKKFKDRQLARDILENNQVELQDIFASKNISANVVFPVWDIGTVLCHANGDIALLLAYLGFDILFAVTIPESLEKKKAQFALFPKINVVVL